LSSIIEHGKRDAFHFEMLRKFIKDGPALIEFCKNYKENSEGHTWEVITNGKL